MICRYQISKYQYHKRNKRKFRSSNNKGTVNSFSLEHKLNIQTYKSTQRTKMAREIFVYTNF